MKRWTTLTCAVSFAIAWQVAAADPAEVSDAIRKLGSNRFAEREAAAKVLETIGEPALPALQEATKSTDPEVKRRAEEIVRHIGRHVENAKLLEPTRVSLDLRDRTVAEAVAELSKVSKYRVQLQGNVSESNRKVTLSVNQVPFWEALERLCSTAALTHDGSTQLPPAQRVAVEASILLTDGKPRPRTTYRHGAAELRLLPETEAGSWTMEVCLEPKLQPRGELSVRINKAEDENGKALEQRQALVPAGEKPQQEQPQQAIAGGVIIGGAAGVRMNRFVGRVGGMAPPIGRRIPIVFQLPADAGKTLAKLTGTVSIPVNAQTRIVIDDPLDAEKRKKAQEGSPLACKVTDVRTIGNGQVTVELDVTPTPGNAAIQAGGGGIQIQNIQVGNGVQVVVNNQVFTSSGSAATVVLEDADGQAYSVVNSGASSTVNPAGIKMTQRYTMTPVKPGAKPARLTIGTFQPTVVEVPFEFKNLPLKAER